MLGMVTGTSRAAPGAVPGRRTAYASLACTLVAGIVVFLEATMTDLPGSRWPVLWWCSFVLLLAVQLVATGLVARPSRVPGKVWLPALAVLALLTFALYPDHGLTAAFIVVSAAAVARHASRRAIVGVIALQTVVATVAVALVGWPLVDVLAGIVAYSGFQTFGALVVLAARGETEARRELADAHEELRATVTLLEETSRDAERLRIARELHDVLGHQLTALALELEVAGHRVTGSPGHEHVVRSRTIAKELLGDVRAAIGEMRDAPHGLEPTLSVLARNVPGLQVSVRVVEDGTVDPDQAQVILRCAQEAITNTLRHASAERLDVVVEAASGGISIKATDDGQGAERIVPGHGLTGMRERLEALGGTLVVESGPGQGFSLVGRLPRARSAGGPT